MKYEDKDKLTLNQTKERTKRLNEAYNELLYKGIVHKHEDVAKTMGATRPSVSAALAGDPRFVTFSFLRRFANAFSDVFNLDWLLHGTGTMLKDRPATASPYDQPFTAPSANEETISVLKQYVADLKKQLEDKDTIISLLRSQYNQTLMPIDMAAENQK